MNVFVPDAEKLKDESDYIKAIQNWQYKYKSGNETTHSQPLVVLAPPEIYQKAKESDIITDS